MKDFLVRRGAHWIVMSLFLTVAGCGGDSGTNGGTPTETETTTVATTSVTVSNDFFDPASIQVSPNATVTWTWDGGSLEGHNVTFASTVSAPSDTQTTGTFEVTMPANGSFTYQCTIHAGMNGLVTVQ